MADAETWARRVAEWRASGLTAGEFAAGRGFEGSTLRWWASRLGREQSAFVRVVTAPAAEPVRDGPIEVHVGEARVVVRSGFDRATLAEVLAVLRGSSAR